MAYVDPIGFLLPEMVVGAIVVFILLVVIFYKTGKMINIF